MSCDCNIQETFRGISDPCLAAMVKESQVAPMYKTAPTTISAPSRRSVIKTLFTVWLAKTPKNMLIRNEAYADNVGFSFHFLNFKGTFFCNSFFSLQTSTTEVNGIYFEALKWLKNLIRNTKGLAVIHFQWNCYVLQTSIHSPALDWQENAYLNLGK